MRIAENLREHVNVCQVSANWQSNVELACVSVAYSVPWEELVSVA